MAASASREQLVYVIDVSKAAIPEALEVLTVGDYKYFLQIVKLWPKLCLSGSLSVLRGALWPERPSLTAALVPSPALPRSSLSRTQQQTSRSRTMLTPSFSAIVQDAVLNPKFALWEVNEAAERLEEDIKALGANPQQQLLEVTIELKTSLLSLLPCDMQADAAKLAEVPRPLRVVARPSAVPRRRLPSHSGASSTAHAAVTCGSAAAADVPRPVSCALHTAQALPSTGGRLAARFPRLMLLCSHHHPPPAS